MKKDNIENAVQKPTGLDKHSLNPPTPSASSQRPSVNSPSTPKESNIPTPSAQSKNPNSDQTHNKK